MASKFHKLHPYEKHSLADVQQLAELLLSQASRDQKALWKDGDGYREKDVLPVKTKGVITEQDVKRSKIWVTAALTFAPDKVPGQYLLSDVIRYLIHSKKLKLVVANIDAAALRLAKVWKRLVQKLRDMTRNTLRSATKQERKIKDPALQAMKDLVVFTPRRMMSAEEECEESCEAGAPHDVCAEEACAEEAELAVGDDTGSLEETFEAEDDACAGEMVGIEEELAVGDDTGSLEETFEAEGACAGEVVGGEEELAECDDMGSLEEPIGGEEELAVCDDMGSLEEPIGGEEELAVCDDMGSLEEPIGGEEELAGEDDEVCPEETFVAEDNITWSEEATGRGLEDDWMSQCAGGEDAPGENDDAGIEAGQEMLGFAGPQEGSEQDLQYATEMFDQAAASNDKDGLQAYVKRDCLKVSGMPMPKYASLVRDGLLENPPGPISSIAQSALARSKTQVKGTIMKRKRRATFRQKKKIWGRGTPRDALQEPAADAHVAHEVPPEQPMEQPQTELEDMTLNGWKGCALDAACFLSD